jgi:hypothetical protein
MTVQVLEEFEGQTSQFYQSKKVRTPANLTSPTWHQIGLIESLKCCIVPVINVGLYKLI